MAAHCIIEGCEKNTHNTRMCPMHRKRLKVHGDPLKTKFCAPGEPMTFLERALGSETDECILWPFSINKQTGYGDIRIEEKTYRVHRVVCRRANGKPPTPKHESAHSCNKRACINKRHLRWATRVENQADRIDHGTSNRGERQWNNRLTEDEARMIKGMKSGHSPTVAAQYQVAPRTVRDIWNGKTWAWL